VRVFAIMRNYTLIFIAVCLLAVALFTQEASADKHEIIKKLVLKKIFKSLKKAKFLPIVVPFHLSKHQQSHGWEDQGGWHGGEEKWHVQELGGGGGGHGGWDMGGGW